MKIKQNYNLAKETFFRVGGEVDYYAEIESLDDFKQLPKLILNYENLPKLVAGACSNMLVADSGFPGVVIKNHIQKLVFLNENEVVIGAGELLPKAMYEIAKKGLGGMEHLANIPGTVGGGIRGNVEAHGQSIADCLQTVNWCYFDGSCQKIDKEKCGFAYRESKFKRDWDSKGMIVEATFKLKKAESKNLLKTIMADRIRRKQTQPSDWSCGCFFKNVFLDQKNYDLIAKKWGDKFLANRNIGDYFSAGMLIDKMGLMGAKIGGAEVSLKHANFIVNTGSATALDIYNLYKLVQKEVLEKAGIELENEVQIVGKFNN